MATFKVGDRVKRARDPIEPDSFPAHLTDMPIGATGTVESLGSGKVWVVPDNHTTAWGCYPYTLEPLTPPDSAEWAQEKVKQVTRPIHEPIRTKESA